jgi:hypothetical protein
MFDDRMNEEQVNTQTLDERIVRALEMSPDAAPFIPDDFAARMAARVPARQAISLTPTHYGRNVMLVSMAVLLAVLLFLARGGSNNSPLGILWEWCLCAQLIALAVWLSVRRWGLR